MVRRRPGARLARQGDPVATAKHFVDGWFHPRDVAMVTPGGVLRYLGRKDDMMKLANINIFSAEIERVLEEHPAVAGAAAFPIPSAVHGEIPAAAVELRAPGDVDAPSLSACARERLGVRAPRRIAILDALPRNATGKVVKRDLARMLAPRASGSCPAFRRARRARAAASRTASATDGDRQSGRLRIQSAVPYSAFISGSTRSPGAATSSSAIRMHASQASRSALAIGNGRWRARSRGWPNRST